MSTAKVCVRMLENQLTSADALEMETGEKLQGKCLELISPITPVKVYSCFLLLTILVSSVVGLFVAMSVAKREQVIEGPLYAACPRDWIGFRNKCFYFSEDTRNWTFSQTSCLSLEAQLAQFDSLEELNFLSRYKGTSDHWIGLYRESSQHAWKWTDNTEYNNMAFIRGVGEHAYLNHNGISSARVYIDRKWICSKTHSYFLQCPKDLKSFIDKVPK